MDVTLRPATGGGTWRPTVRPPALPMAGLRWAAWAARVAGRYDQLGAPWAWLSAILRRAGAPTAAPAISSTAGAPTVYAPWTLALTLRLVTPIARQTVMLPNAAPHLLTPAEPWASAQPQAAAQVAGRLETRPVERLIARVAEPAAGRIHERVTRINRYESALVERMLARQRREESGSRSGSAPFVASQPLPRVVRQSAPAIPATAQPQPPVAQPAPLRYWENAAQPLPPDIERLADQVIHTIDQRVTAARERLGRG